MVQMIGAKDFAREKLFSYGIALLFILFLTPVGVADSYLILGHAHFMMTALYFYKAGRIPPKKFIFYLVLFAAMFKIAHLFPLHYTVFASAFLLVHVFSGEIRHLKRSYSLPYAILTAALMLILCTWMSMKMWDFDVNMKQLIAVTNCFALYAGIIYWKHGKINGSYEPFFPTLLCLYVFYVSLEYTGHRPAGFDSFGFIVIAHYLTTYFNVTISFNKKSRAKAWLFIKESIAMNALFLAGYLLIIYGIGKDNVLHTYVYDRISFYVWTVMHFIVTWNWAEYKDIFKFPALLPGKTDARPAESGTA